MITVKPLISPPLDKTFQPATLFNREFCRRAVAEKHFPLVIAVERPDGTVSTYSSISVGHDSQLFMDCLIYVERIVKFMLWQKGGHKIYICGNKDVYDHLKKTYSPTGARAFDCEFMERVYERPFDVIFTEYENAPLANEVSKSIGRHLEGCRIGFDAGASDRKVSAVIDGNAVYSEEVIWDPRSQTDPSYHYNQINASFKAAADKMPRVDAIGVSSAGVYINNQVMLGSLFRGVPQELFNTHIKPLFLNLQKEWNCPLEVVNDGEVTALAGSMSLDVNAILGVAMGSSEAAGYVTRQGAITNWLNELAFAPIDYSPTAPIDEWSGDRGVGALYFSQQAIFRLAPIVGIQLDENAGLAERLKAFQDLHFANDPRTRDVYETIGVYFGYGVAHYADFYDLEHVLVLGRVTTGSGGQIILNKANEVLKSEFPELANKISLHLPDEKSRRVGQSIAAASLPELQ